MPQGYNASADLLTRTADGRDLNELWADYQAVLAEWNAERQRLVNFLTYPVTNPVEDIPVVSNSGDFQPATEYGVPTSIRPEVDYWSLGFDFAWYDLAARFTWQFLADAPASRVDAVQNQALEADSRLVFTRVMRQIFNNTNRNANIRGNAYNVYTFYNGNGEAPPPYKSNTFDSSHSHYFRTGATTIDPGDLEDHIDALAEHGYDQQNGYRLVTMMNKTETEVVRLFRLGTNGATYDFIPAQGTPGILLPTDVRLFPQGVQPVPNTLNGLKVVGSYGPLTIVEEDYIPTKYFFSFATGGPDSIQNPIGFREHANASLRGMRLVKGRNPDYPLIDSYYVRGFGTGVRHRGAGVVSQIASSTGYTPPSLYA
jgi:hypothetical protein